MSPMMWPVAPPKAKAKPTAQYRSAAIEKFVRILATTVPAFLPREKPISRKAKPACMNMTKQPATITHIELIPTESGNPLPAASKVSAMAAAGSTSRATSAQSERHGPLGYVRMDPPGSSAPRSLLRRPPERLSPGVERSARRFAIRSRGAAVHAGRTAAADVFDGWIRSRVAAAD